MYGHPQLTYLPQNFSSKLFFLENVWLGNTLPTYDLDICPHFRSFFFFRSLSLYHNPFKDTYRLCKRDLKKEQVQKMTVNLKGDDIALYVPRLKMFGSFSKLSLKFQSSSSQNEAEVSLVYYVIFYGEEKIWSLQLCPPNLERKK